MNTALLSSKNMCWCTPQDFFDKLTRNLILCLTQRQPPKRQSVAYTIRLKRTGFRKIGIAAARFSATLLTGAKSANGFKKHIGKRAAGGILLFCLFPPERTQIIFTIIYTGKRKSALFAVGFGLLTAMETLLILLHFRQW